MEIDGIGHSGEGGISPKASEFHEISEVHSYAQTNIHLYKQLKSEGYSLDEINHVRKAYDLAIELFACLYCPSGKTFLAHVVGVGSILGSLRISSDVVAASLLHDVYESGDFGEGWSLDQKKTLVRETVGPKTEHYIGEYQALEWSRSTIPVIRNKINYLNPFERNVLMVRLSNELEDLLDGGILFCPDAKSRRLHFRNLGHLHVEMAELLGYPTLAVEFNKALKETYEATSIRPIIPEGARTSPAPFRLIPLSYTYPPMTVIRNRMDHGIQRVARTLRLATIMVFVMGTYSSNIAHWLTTYFQSTSGG